MHDVCPTYTWPGHDEHTHNFLDLKDVSPKTEALGGLFMEEMTNHRIKTKDHAKIRQFRYDQQRNEGKRARIQRCCPCLRTVRKMLLLVSDVFFKQSRWFRMALQ